MIIKTVCEPGYEPVRAHPFDAGADLRSARDIAVGCHVPAMVGTGVRAAVPEGYVGLVFARSSLCKRGLAMANGVGVIDSGYAGEIRVPLLATRRGVLVERGERIAQLVVVPCMLPEFSRVESLGETERGEGGFGSTGAM